MMKCTKCRREVKQHKVDKTDSGSQRLAFAKHGAGAGVDSAWKQKKLKARKMLENAADWASELQANIAHSKRVNAGAPQRPVHAVLGGS